MSPQVMNLSHSARLLFIGLITQADDAGRGTADVRRIKAAIFGGDDVTSVSVHGWLNECAAQKLITLYATESHGDLYELPTWHLHQRINRPSPSNYPPPPDSEGAHGAFSERSLSTHWGSDGKEGSEGEEGSLGSDGSERIREAASTPARGTPSAPDSATPISEDWQPSERNLEWLASTGLTAEQQREVIAEFVRYWVAAGARKTAKNWDVAFVRNPKVKSAIAQAAAKRNGTAKPRDPEKTRRNVLELAKLMRIEQGDDDWETFERRVMRANEKRIANLGEQPRRRAGASA